MPDLRWDEVREPFDPDLMGALPDLFVPDATVQDWQTVLDLVTVSGWQWQYEEGSTVLPLPAAVTVLARPAGAEIAHLRTWPVPGVLAIFRFMSETEISFDVDLRELQGQEGIDTLCAFLRADRKQAGQAGADDARGRKPGAPGPRLRSRPQQGHPAHRTDSRLNPDTGTA